MTYSRNGKPIDIAAEHMINAIVIALRTEAPFSWMKQCANL